MSERNLQEFSEQFTGTVRPMLVEHETHGRMGGFTDNYLRVELPDIRSELANRVVPVRLKQLAPDAAHFEGELID
jgi:tRNA A37 methylthiotransferase MiaB